MSDASGVVRRHFTLRRGFAVLLGLLVLALYFIWAVYGAAPTSLSFIADAEGQSESGGHGAHGASAGGMTPEEFAELTEEFVAQFSLSDGSVKPRRVHGAGEAMHAEAGHAEGEEHADRDAHGAMAGMPSMAGDEDHATGKADAEHGADTEESAAHAEVASEESTGSEEHGMAKGDMAAGTDSASNEEEEGHGHNEGAEPIDVYLMATQFFYEPAVLRLDHGVPYRFRMMSMDVNHGASIHTGFAGHIMRRPARTMVEMVMTFTEPGEYMVYCTVYCGEGHDMMKSKIIVE